MAKDIKYEHILGKGRDMASDEYPPDKDVTIDTKKPMSGANRVVGSSASQAGAGRGVVNPSADKPQRSAQVDEAIQEMQDAKVRKKISGMGYKSGGSVSSASRRADGIASKGKTRGKMC
jgi:hypothetical protein